MDAEKQNEILEKSYIHSATGATDTGFYFVDEISQEEIDDAEIGLGESFTAESLFFHYVSVGVFILAEQ